MTTNQSSEQKWPPRFLDDTPEAAEFRWQQGQIDADIEGLADDPDVRKVVDELRSSGMSIDQMLAALADYLRDRYEPDAAAAE